MFIIGELFAIFILFPWIFRKIADAVFQQVYYASTSTKFIVGVLWGVVVATSFHFFITAYHLGLIMSILSYLAGAYCSQLAYQEDPKIMRNMSIANLTGIISYIAMSIFNRIF